MIEKILLITNLTWDSSIKDLERHHAVVVGSIYYSSFMEQAL